MSGHHTAVKRSTLGWFAVCFLAVAAVLMVSGHRAHVLNVVPYLFLLACPLMHLLMHKNHEHDHGERRRREDTEEK